MRKGKLSDEEKRRCKVHREVLLFNWFTLRDLERKVNNYRFTKEEVKE